MAWIKSNQELAQHPKVKRLARMLEITVPDAIGRLHLLWWWAMDYAQDGDLSKFDALDIADAMMWDGDPQRLIESLVQCGSKGSGFLDMSEAGALTIHDWDEHCGHEFEKREKDAQRKRESRQRQKEYSDVRRPSAGRPLDVRTPSDVRGEEKRGEEKRGEKKESNNINNNNIPPSPKPAAPILDLEGAQALTTLTQMYELCPDYVPDPPKEIRLVQELQQEHTGAPLVAEFRKARDWLEGKPVKERKKNLRAFLRNWVSNAVNKYGAGQKFAGYQEFVTFVPDTGGGAGNA